MNNIEGLKQEIKDLLSTIEALPIKANREDLLRIQLCVDNIFSNPYLSRALCDPRDAFWNFRFQDDGTPLQKCRNFIRSKVEASEKHAPTPIIFATIQNRFIMRSA